jgi:hypothetical protein
LRNQELYEVIHSFIDFRVMILGSKLNKVHEDNRLKDEDSASNASEVSYIFNNVELATLMMNMAKKGLLKSTTVKQIIDMQWQLTYEG